MRSLINQYGHMGITMIMVLIMLALFYHGINGTSVTKHIGQEGTEIDEVTTLQDDDTSGQEETKIVNQNNSVGTNIVINRTTIFHPYNASNASATKYTASEIFTKNDGSAVNFTNTTIYFLTLYDANHNELKDLRANKDVIQNGISFPAQGIYYLKVKIVQTNGVESVGEYLITVNG